MKLEFLMYFLSDNMNINIIYGDTMEIANTYDGKNSIDEEFNECEVLMIKVSDEPNTLDIYIADEFYDFGEE